MPPHQAPGRLRPPGGLPRPPYRCTRTTPSCPDRRPSWSRKSPSRRDDVAGDGTTTATVLAPTGAVPVRDSKDPSGPVVTVGAGAWQAFVDGLR
ncbi:DUF397 domain-containing protein [Streptomyces tendae]